MMAKGYGLDYVKKEVKRDAKGFYKSLKQMAAAFPEFKNKPKNYKFENINESVINEFVSANDFNKDFNTAMELVIKQAQNLKGQLSKHPIKRNVNKLKAVQKLYKKFIAPVLIKKNESLRYGFELNDLKKDLANGKFKSAIQYEIMNRLSGSSFRGNSFYFLDDKEKKLLDRIYGELRKLTNVMDDAQLENINEDGHTDVASAKRKVMIMVDDSNKLLNKLNGMSKEDSLPSWLSDKITIAQSNLSKSTDYLLNPVESVNEIRNNREAQTTLDQIGNRALYMIGAKQFATDGKSLTFKIMRNSKGVSHIRIKLTSSDLYDMEFLSIRAGRVKVKKKEKGVYADQLRVFIKKHTGLNVRL